MNLKTECVFQLINTEFGTRSASMTATISEFADILYDLGYDDLEKQPQTYVLILWENLTDQEMSISRHPLILTKTFVELFKTTKEDSHE